MASASHSGRKPRVVVLQKSLFQYRVAFFEAVQHELHDLGVDFKLIYGQPTGADSLKADSQDLSSGVFLPSRQIGWGRRRLLWQPALRHLKRGDLVVVEQASKLLINYVLLIAQALGFLQVAFWGHGRSILGTRTGETVKRWISTRPRRWFAYTEGTRQIIESMGYPSDRITVADNAIDTARLVLEAEQARAALREAPRNRALFVGALYGEKRLDYLLEAAALIRSRIPTFELVIVGDGPDRPMVTRAAENCDWICYDGPRFGPDLARCLVESNLMLVPGWVGLVILDAFAAQCPLVTVDSDRHPPEIEYLQDGVNGRCLDGAAGPETYAAAVIAILQDPEALDRLRSGCRLGAERYTLENMARRFVDGCVHALAGSAGPPPRQRFPGQFPRRVARLGRTS